MPRPIRNRSIPAKLLQEFPDRRMPYGAMASFSQRWKVSRQSVGKCAKDLGFTIFMADGREFPVGDRVPPPRG